MARGVNLNGHLENKEATHWQWKHHLELGHRKMPSFIELSYIKCFDFSFVTQLSLVSKRTDFRDRLTTCI
jgi:hypothetical protein